MLIFSAKHGHCNTDLSILPATLFCYHLLVLSIILTQDHNTCNDRITGIGSLYNHCNSTSHGSSYAIDIESSYSAVTSGGHKRIPLSKTRLSRSSPIERLSCATDNSTPEGAYASDSKCELNTGLLHTSHKSWDISANTYSNVFYSVHLHDIFSYVMLCRSATFWYYTQGRMDRLHAQHYTQLMAGELDFRPEVIRRNLGRVQMYCS